MGLLTCGTLAAVGARYGDSIHAGIAALWAVFGVCNVFAFALFAYDKRVSKSGDVSDRVPEKDLLWALALAGEWGETQSKREMSPYNSKHRACWGMGWHATVSAQGSKADICVLGTLLVGGAF